MNYIMTPILKGLPHGPLQNGYIENMADHLLMELKLVPKTGLSNDT